MCLSFRVQGLDFSVQGVFGGLRRQGLDFQKASCFMKEWMRRAWLSFAALTA